jgi:ATP-dependent DNA helicase RecG
MLPTTPDALDRFLHEKEGPNLECKTARTDFDSRKLRKYLCALANEGGGYLVLGVTDQPPRHVVGTAAFANVQADIRNIRQDLKPPPTLKATEIDHPDGRVVFFEVGSRAHGQVVRYERVRWARDGESLTDMDDAALKAILLEQTDVTAEPCPGATLYDLDPEAIARFRRGVVRKARAQEQKRRYDEMSPADLLRATGLVRPDGTLYNATLLLLGTEDALDRWAPNAEIVFEYRSEPRAPRYDDRIPVRQALILAVETLWSAIQPYARLRPIEVQEGTLVSRKDRFAERSIREAILNAVAHRDYFDLESVRIRMAPDAFEVTSPGPFPPTITPENVAEEQHRRNRKLAEALDKCGEIERSGQGVDLMMEAAVQRAQPLPTFEEPDGHRVRVTLHGEVDLDALPVVSRIPDDVWPKLGPPEFVALDAVRRGRPRREVDAGAARQLAALGLIQPGGPGDAPYFYASALTSLAADRFFSRLPHLFNLLFDHPEGLRFSQLQDRVEVHGAELKRQLQWLRRNGLVRTTGRTKGTRWHAVGKQTAGPDD